MIGARPGRDVVLLGGGHSHVLAARMLAMRAIPGVRYTLVSPDSWTAYSGMLPGFVAGHYVRTAGKRGVFYGFQGTCDGGGGVPDALTQWYGASLSAWPE